MGAAFSPDAAKLTTENRDRRTTVMHRFMGSPCVLDDGC
jgi:hypothetical protein